MTTRSARYTVRAVHNGQQKAIKFLGTYESVASAIKELYPGIRICAILREVDWEEEWS